MMFLASSNRDKIREISTLLGNRGGGLKSLEDFNLDSPEESGKTFSENALLKARFGFEKTGLTTLADDSGFCLETLGNFPGIFSGRFAKEQGGFENAAKTLHGILGDRSRKAHFITVVAIVYVDRAGKTEEHLFEGRVNGCLCYPPRGKNGFGYCSCFKPDGFNFTYGEMDDRSRMGHSHRAIALSGLVKFLESRER
jgi:XTP/dITP diphosphohydrolase